MNLDIQIEGTYSQRTEDLMHLRQRQSDHETPLDLPSEHAVNTFKALMILFGMFLSLTAVIFMDAQMAFISVTLILIANSAVVIGAEKIITLFPERIWGLHTKK